MRSGSEAGPGASNSVSGMNTRHLVPHWARSIRRNRGQRTQHNPLWDAQRAAYVDLLMDLTKRAAPEARGRLCDRIERTLAARVTWDGDPKP